MAKDKITAESDINEKLSWLSSRYKTNLEIEYLDTGSIILNKLFGGGLPMTKNIQIYSESGYGKSTITISMCKALCRAGHRVLYIDAEGSVNENLLKTMGILTNDENNLLYDDLSFTIQIGEKIEKDEFICRGDNCSCFPWLFKWG